MLKEKMRYLIITLSLLLNLSFNSTHAAQVEYWELTPQSVMRTEDNTVYNYLATILVVRKTSETAEVLFRIQDARDEKRFTQTWVKSTSNEDQRLEQFSMGDQVILTLDPLYPKEVTIADSSSSFEPFSIETSWLYTDTQSWVIPSDIIAVSKTSLALDGIEYDIYAGCIIKAEYWTWISSNSSDFEHIHHEMEIDIAIQGENIKHYSDYKKEAVAYKDSKGRKIVGKELKDLFIRMLRNWTPTDQIKILVNHYYPGFWWIVNETRNEAIFTAQGHTFTADYNLWHRLGN